ncbi:MAG: hypothetical protein ACPGR7_09105 [Flavobacteriaceae bacterium]
MMKIKLFVSLSVILFLNLTAFSQAKTLQEEVLIHVDKKLLVPGDLLKFNFFVRSLDNGRLSEDSDVLYVSLFNQRSERLWTHKLLVQKGVASGDFMMPSDWISGNYLLEAHTLAMQAYGEGAFSTQELLFYNPFQEPKRDEESREAVELVPPTSDVENRKILLQFDHRKYEKRSRVDFKLMTRNGADLDSYFSFKVSLVELIDIEDNRSEPLFLEAKEEPLFEMGGERFTAFVQDANGKAMAEKYLAVSIPDEPFRLMFSRTDENGLADLIIPENRLSDEVFVQVYGKNHRDFKVSMLNKEIKELQPKWVNSIELSESDKILLSDYAIKNQIEASFYDLKSHRLLNKKDDAGQMNLSSKEVFYLDDYSRFPSLKETFTEVIKEASIGKKGAKLISSQTDIKTKYPPLVLFNGVLTQEYEQLMDYNAGQVNRIEIFRDPYSFYDNNFLGLIEIFTIDPELRLYARGNYMTSKRIPPPYKGKRYYNQRYDSGSWENIPDFRRTLFWQAPVYVRGSEQELSIYTSDVAGWYKIELLGVDKNGELTQIIDYFEVK